jgi:hypothetical protein
MSTLVQFLAAGVNGAQSGTATFLFRGSASSAASVLYNDFERTSQPGTNIITLDANGAAEVYCSAYCDVTVKNSAGATLRTVTIGNSSGVVEVRSDSFTGTDYDGSPSNVVNQPVTLTEVLNRWNDSAGTTNFQVLVGGVPTNIQTAFSGFAGIFINVKDPEYGAVGDGVTSDTTAIGAAMAAATASGGIVIFPPGVYLVGSLNISTPNIALIGFGQATLKGTADSTILISDNTLAGVKVISGLRFEGNGAATRAFDIEGNNTVFIDQCTFDEAGFTESLFRFLDNDGLYYITRCRFTLAAAALGPAIYHAAGFDKTVMMTNCHFAIPAGFIRTVIAGSCFNIANCVFDAFDVTSGVYNMIDPEHPTQANFVEGNVANCKFVDGGSQGFVFRLVSVAANCSFSEVNNTFIGFLPPTLTGESGHIYNLALAVAFDQSSHIHLGSRSGRTLHLVSAAATFTASAILMAENLVLEHTGSALEITVPALVPGLSGRIVVFVGAGQPEWEISFEDSAGFGVVLNSAGSLDQDMLSTAGANQAASCGYLTTIRADGTLRSLITSEVNHHL